LAYFAKGPLSRARSAFHLDLESDLDMADLIEFLKSLLLTTVQVDKKYRETIPDVVTKMKSHVDSSDEGGKRKRRPRKMKLGKDGLYPMEEESIRKWWAANKPELGEEQTSYSPSQIKSHVSLLRTRETQLQMILILEILALEPFKAAGDADEDALPLLPGAESQKQEQSMAPPPPPKKRNKHNLPVLIDVHADRLTIWQSTASDEQLLLEDSQVSRGPGDGQDQQTASSEPLKDFCVDVILPL
jgi:DNA replication regulator SLD3